MIGQVLTQDVVGLVEHIGRDIAGALSIGVPRLGKAPGYRPVPDDGELERIIRELPAKPFLAGDDGISMSLAGVQRKLPVAYARGEFAIPVDGAPSTHILKPGQRQAVRQRPERGALHGLARRAGLSVAEVSTGVAGTRSYLLVKRYDRVRRGGRLLRQHQEDFCQALGKPPAPSTSVTRRASEGRRCRTSSPWRGATWDRATCSFCCGQSSSTSC